MPSKLSKRLDRFPPFLCYALCTVRLPQYTRKPTSKWQGRRNWRRINRYELSKRTGIPVRSVERYVQRISWENFLVGDMLRFLDACGIDPLNIELSTLKIKRRMKGLKNKKFQYLTTVQWDLLMRKFREWKGRNGQ